MKHKITQPSSLVYLLVFAITALLSSCGDSIEKQQPVITYPYKFIREKRELRENDGSYNEMTLYTCNKRISIDTLKMFCKAKKDSISDGAFHIITFFDNEKDANFTEFPITSMYGVNKYPANHIKAEYTYVVFNGFSKLTIYDKNSWESKGQVFDIN